MVYFDTDVLINLLIEQDPDKHKFAKELYQSTVNKKRFFISHLCVLETVFVLSKLGQRTEDIETTANAFMSFEPVVPSYKELKRALDLAKLIGFQNISDCFHTAIAESYCKELVTYNKSDFKRIREYTRLKITIL